MTVRRILTFALLTLCAGLLAGCGSEPPAPGELTVTSDPAGAVIALDGVATSHTTPYTFLDLETGIDYMVSVAIADWNPVEAQMVFLPPAGSADAEFVLSQGTGSLAVDSAPGGAAIRIDGTDTGEITPFTFDELVPGDYEVTVQLDGHVSQPAEIVATVTRDAVASVEFTLVPLPQRIVLLEGFSNVYCVGCPAMNANVDAVLHTEGYGPDRALYLKWPAILSPLDPFYWVTTTITDDRVDWYFGASTINLPTLAGDGGVLGGLGTPASADGMMAFIDSQPEFSEVLVTVNTDEDLGDIDDLTHEATVTLMSPGGVDLSGHHLNVVLVYESVETENEGYIDGVTEYHWVMRDHVVPSSDIGVLDAGTSYPFDITLDDPLGGNLPGHDVYPHAKQIIAWVQHASSRDIIQAGSTVTATAQAAVSAVSNPDTPAVQSGGSR